MSKRDRSKRYKPAAQVASRLVSTDEIGDIFFADLIPLDPEFMDHLVNDHGFPRDVVEQMASMGMKYNPLRNSFMSEPEIDF